MRPLLALSVLAMLGGACVTTRGPAPSYDLPLALQSIRDAEVANVARSSRAGDLLARAKSEIEYAKHLPRDPEHARRLCMRAQVDAELALIVARREEHERLMARFDVVRRLPRTSVNQ